ncbi:LOW QUALITY PROTEIN: replication initiation protein, partial [Streptomyces sp. SPB78]
MTHPALTAAGLTPDTLTDVCRVAGAPGFDRWQDQTRRTGGCADPIRLTGGTKTLDAATRQVLHAYTTDHEPGAVLRVACGNRRASRCPSCARTYSADTYHLIRAGLTGDPDKGTPHTVRNHPRAFITLTAPSFGPVHNRPRTGRCRCGTTHPDDAPELSTPLDPDTYDYAGAVLWNNHAGQLWRYLTIYLPRELAKRAGLTQADLKAQLRVSYGKVAEYQKRGAIHFHAVVRLDGPEGPDTPPPPWATLDLLEDAFRAAATRAAVDVPAAGDQPARTLRWGTQLDVRPIVAFGAAKTSPNRPWPPTSPSTPPKPPRPPAPWTAASAAKTPSTSSACPSTPPASSPPASTCTRSTRTSSSATGPTCSASAATSPPSPAATPPPSAPCARPAPTTAPPNNAKPSACPTPTTPKPPPSPSPTGPTPATATPPANPGSPPASPTRSTPTAKPPAKNSPKSPMRKRTWH